MDSAQGRGPASRRADYAEFEVLDPPVNFSLNASDVGVGHGMGPQPFGIQVTRTRHMVGAWESRLEAAGFATEVEAAVTCCHAVGDKFWVTDPDGLASPLAQATDRCCCAVELDRHGRVVDIRRRRPDNPRVEASWGGRTIRRGLRGRWRQLVEARVDLVAGTAKPGQEFLVGDRRVRAGGVLDRPVQPRRGAQEQGHTSSAHRVTTRSTVAGSMVDTDFEC